MEEPKELFESDPLFMTIVGLDIVAFIFMLLSLFTFLVMIHFPLLFSLSLVKVFSFSSILFGGIALIMGIMGIFSFFFSD